MFQPAEEAAALPANKMLCVARSAASANLIVCFNGYGNRAFRAPDLPFATRLEGIKLWENQDAHAVWFAEQQSTWYLQHEAEIIDILLSYITDNGINRVKLVGASAGGYAALRIGLLLDEALGRRPMDAEVLAFAINPQTGFRPALIESMRQAVSLIDWRAADVGTNPILLSAQYQHAFGDRELDLSRLAAGMTPRHFAGVIYFDCLNPIEQAFTGDLSSIPFITTVPQSLGLPHAPGCVRIWGGEVWCHFDAMMPCAPIEPTQREMQQLY